MKIKFKGLNKETRDTLKGFLETINYQLCKDLDYTIYICEEDKKRHYHNKYQNTVFDGVNCYRAITLPVHKKIFVYFNRGETIESLQWLIIHELTHANLRSNPFLKSILQIKFKSHLKKFNITTEEEYNTLLKNDEFHETMFEEQLCNTFATTVINHNYDRIWWREQLKENVS